MVKNIIIAIDGEASSGKSTQAKKIADYFGYYYLDSGAFYRAITLFFKRNKFSSVNQIDSNDLINISLSSKYKNGKNLIKHKLYSFIEKIKKLKLLKLNATLPQFIV